MKKHLHSLVRSVFLLCSFSLILSEGLFAQTAVAPETGDGSSGNPYQIATWQNLYWISQNNIHWDKHYIQTADIDFADATPAINTWNSGTGWNTIGQYGNEFTGHYDGQNHTVSGLIAVNSYPALGLFGYTYNAVILNIGMISVDLSTTSYEPIGGLIGACSNSTVSNCYATGSISAYRYGGGLIGKSSALSVVSNSYSSCSVNGGASGTEGYNFGGLIGSTEGATVNNCYSTGDVLNGNNNNGGLIGQSINTSYINNCYSMNNVTGNQNKGGLVGNCAYTEITNSYSTGSVSVTNIFGGLVGGLGDGCTITSCFWDTQTSGTTDGVGSIEPDPSGVTGKTTGEMTDYFTYYDAGWDLMIEAINGTNGYWGKNSSSNNGYPFLEWQGYTSVAVPEASTQSATDIASVSATSNGTIASLGLPNPTQHGFCWNTTGMPTVADNKTEKGSVSSTGAFTSSITGLSNSTTYYVRAYATNSVGTVYGEEISFTTPFWDGTGTSLDPYTISGLNNLQTVSSDVGYWDKHFIQVADIDASATSGWNSGEGFISIGSIDNKFTGSYDGQGHTISNLFINRGSYSGFFGYTDGATIQNLGVVNCSISGGEAVGGLIGLAKATNVNQCFSTGSITATWWSSGGLIGLTSTSTIINNSYSHCNVNGNQGVGGLVGNLTGSSVNNCYSNGTISGNSYIGGLVGLEGTVMSSFWDMETSGQTNSDGGTGKTTAEMEAYSTYFDAGWDFMDETANGTNNYWGINEMGTQNSGYPFLQWQGYSNKIVKPNVTTQAVSSIGATAATGNGNITFLGDPNASQYGICWSTSENPTINDYKTTEGAASAIGAFTCDLTGLTKNTTYYVRAYATNDVATVYGEQVSFTTKYFDGEGTEVDPYQISNLTDLRNLSENSSFWNKHFIQTADIDATETSGWNSGSGWSPIGEQLDDFTGSYNGQGHTISGISISRPNNDNQGFFGFTSGANIQNLGIINANITGRYQVGSLIGSNYYSSTIRNCYSTGSVNGIIIGVLVGDNRSSTISNCFSNVSVNGDSYIGALVGYNDASTVNNCYSKGTVSGSNWVGGLVGENENSTVTNSFWDIETSNQATSSGGTGKTTSEMKLYSTFLNAGWDFMVETTNGTENIWGINPTENNGYPFLAWQGYEHIVLPIVTTQAVTDIAIESATGNGDISELGIPALTNHGICWKTSGDPNLLDSKTEEGAASVTGAFTSPITGLSAYTTYYVRAYAVNIADTVYGEQVSFTTLPTSPTITTDSITEITTATATANGNITDLGIPNPTQHGFCWSTLEEPTTLDSKTEEGSVAVTGAFTSSITGLVPYTTNYVRAYATNESGTVYGAQLSFTTAAEQATVTTQNASDITSISATGKGNIVSLGAPNPTQHGVCWNTTGNPDVFDSKTDEGEVSITGAFTSAITGLSAYTTYYVRAYAINLADTVYGEQVSFNTLPTLPQVTTDSVSDITQITATGNGNINGMGIPNPTQHGFCWSTSENPTTADSITEDGAVSSTGEFTSSITGLSAYTTYYVRAYATNEAGTAYGIQLSFTTSAQLPTVTTQAATLITTSTAVGNGTITDLGAPNPTQHGVCWNTAGNPSLSNFFTEEGAASSTGAFTSIMSGLSPNTTYYVKAYAINDGGTSYGDEVSFTTLQNISAVMSGSWSNPVIWGGIVPGAGDNVIIPAGLLITVDGAKETANCNDLTIEPTADLTIDGTLNINGNLLVKGDATGQGSLIDNGTLNVSGTQQVEKLLTPNRWWYITSPVDSTNSTVFDANNTSHYIFWWEETASNHGWNQIYNADVPMDTIMKGYAVFNTDSDKLLTFEGELNTGTKSIGLTRTDGVSKEGYNLIGNPYPSAYDLYMFHDGFDIGSSIYYRTENEGVMNFATYNSMYEIAGTNGGQRYVPSMQAFWIRVPEGNTTGVVEFNNTKRVHSNQSFYKSSDVPVVRLSISKGSKSDETIIIFSDQETEGFSIYDSEKMEINNDEFPRLYTIDYDKNLAINSLPEFEVERTVPLGMCIPECGDYHFAMNSLENIDAKVILEDRLTETFTDLAKHAYDFYTTDSENLERFVLHFYKSSTEVNNIEQNGIDIYSYEDNVIIRLNSLSASGDRYEIFDLTGNIIESGQLTKTVTRVKQTERDQMVIVKVLNNKRVTIKKVIVN